jgi:hypothetical protein
VARHRNRGETLDLATDLLVIDSVPPAAWQRLAQRRQAPASIRPADRHGGPGPDASTASDVLMVLVSIIRDTGNFEAAHRQAREHVTRDSADTGLRSRKGASLLAGTRFIAPVDELNCELRSGIWHKPAALATGQLVRLLG